MQIPRNEFFLVLINRTQKTMATSLQSGSNSFTQVIHPYYTPQKIQGGIVSTVTMLWAGWSRIQISRGPRDFLLSKMSRPALWPTQHPIQWVPWYFPPGGKMAKVLS